MKVAYFDCFSGISGDMVLGAFLDLGIPLAELTQALRGLPLEGYSIRCQKVDRGGIVATQAIVECRVEHVHRGFSEIRAMIEASPLPERTRRNAIACFHMLAQAEAHVHGVELNEVHFHEVGAVDAIVDIVGSMWCAERLGIERAWASEVVVGSGTVRAAHGDLPVPAPATALLLEGVPVTDGGRVGELTTPTGAAILRTLVSEFGKPYRMTIQRVGYGAGSRQDKGYANCLRILLGEAAGLPSDLESRRLALVQTEIDDMSGEIFGFVQEKLLTAGALDVALIPIQMKKNRPAVSIQVLVPPEGVNSVVELLLRETTTFGVKVIECDRYCLAREVHKLTTPFGTVGVKVGYWGEHVLKVSPEYEDCRRLALEKGVALREVMAAAQRAAQQWLEDRWEKNVYPTE